MRWCLNDTITLYNNCTHYLILHLQMVNPSFIKCVNDELSVYAYLMYASWRAVIIKCSPFGLKWAQWKKSMSKKMESPIIVNE